MYNYDFVGNFFISGFFSRQSYFLSQLRISNKTENRDIGIVFGFEAHCLVGLIFSPPPHQQKIKLCYLWMKIRLEANLCAHMHVNNYIYRENSD